MAKLTGLESNGLGENRLFERGGAKMELSALKACCADKAVKTTVKFTPPVIKEDAEVSESPDEIIVADKLTSIELLKEKGNKDIPLRTNFNETAFFYPHLYSDSTGKVTITFTLPESLTRWKFMALAHNKELASGYLEQEVVAQKELMAEVQAPRFVVQGDQITLPVKVQNMGTGPLSGFVELELTDALSGEPLKLIGKDKLKQPFQCKPSETVIVLYSFVIPDTLSSLQI